MLMYLGALITEKNEIREDIKIWLSRFTERPCAGRPRFHFRVGQDTFLFCPVGNGVCFPGGKAAGVGGSWSLISI
jgi:hypothetical protein